ncbi:MAG: hypothetical protein NTW29_10140 [Bacteroidetes bacterium]|nr:hypothetical protein [Bacteroidota bacterium]
MPLSLSRIILFVAACFIISCGNNSDSKPTSAADTTQPTAPVQDTITNQPPSFSCQVLPEDSMGIPHSILYLQSGGKKITIDTIYSCGEIAPAEYAEKKIPADALMALGGWWAGSGDYFYLVVRNGKPVVYAGWQDEQQTDEGYHWEEKKLKE